MIKRRYYKLEHGDRDAPSESSSSSSSSDSELEAEATEDSGEDDAQVRQEDESASSSSGYESEDSSAHEVNLDSSGLPTSDKDVGPQRNGQTSEDHSSGRGNTDSVDLQLSSEANKDEKDPSDFPDCVVKCKSVFKCKLCPRIVCLSEETLNAHLKSKKIDYKEVLVFTENTSNKVLIALFLRDFKRHARSEKLFREGRLKLMLDMDGKFDEETAPSVASAENSGKSLMKKRGLRGQKSRLKKKKKT